MTIEHEDAGGRVRQSRRRLRDLYQEDVNPRFQTPHVPAIKTVFVITLLTFTVLLGTMLYKFNVFIVMQEEVFATRGHLEGAYQRRINLFDNLLNLTINHAELEHEVFSYIADARSNIIKKLNLPPELQKSVQQSLATAKNPDINGLGEALAKMNQGGFESSMGRLLGLVEQYPNIKSSETYARMMESLVEIENNISLRRSGYQETIRMFNMEISRFPWYMVAEVAGFERFDYFSAEEDAHFRPNILDAELATGFPPRRAIPLAETNNTAGHGVK